MAEIIGHRDLVADCGRFVPRSPSLVVVSCRGAISCQGSVTASVCEQNEIKIFLELRIKEL
jgi:hypothetical protein